jgi:hypothetical protein
MAAASMTERAGTDKASNRSETSAVTARGAGNRWFRWFQVSSGFSRISSKAVWMLPAV